MRVLVVDDEPAARLMAEALVRAAGHEVETAAGGAEALARLPDGFDVLITDARMPGMSGFQLAEQVRRNVGRYVYLIMLTSLQDDEERLAGMRAGVDDYLVKPLRRTTLLAQLIAAERVVALHRTIEEQRRVLQLQATHDALTGVYNRLRLDEDLADLVARAQRYGHGFCVALLDVDRFKAFNDTYGHLAGDDALRTVAARLQASVRTGDAVYRYGGEEFVLLLPACTAREDAVAACDRVRRSTPGEQTASAGVALWDGIEPPHTLLERADRALYAAKEDGRDRTAFAG